MNETRGNKGIIVDDHFYENALVPVLAALGWTARLHVDPPEGAMIIREVVDLYRTGYVKTETVEEVVKAIQTASDYGATVADQGLPGWVDLRRNGQGPADRSPFRLPPEINLRADWRVPSEIPPEVSFAAEEAEKVEERKPADDVFDFQQFRADPEQLALLEEYEKAALTVSSRDMVDAGRDGFLERGWIYTGEHYGDGSIVIQVVLGKDDKIVPRSQVAYTLTDLSIRVGEDFQENDLDHDLETGEVAESIPFDDIPEAPTEGEVPHGAHLMGAEEEDEMLPRVVLEEGQKFGVKTKAFKQSGRAVVSIEIASNIVTVDCDPRQALEFFRDCASIICNLLDSNVENQEKEAEQNEHTEGENISE